MLYYFWKLQFVIMRYNSLKIWLKIQFILIFFLIYVFYFIYFLLCWVFVAARRLSLVAMSRGYSSLRCAGSRHGGFSSCASRALECRLSSCGSWASLLRGMWDLPGQGLNPCPLHWQADS